MALIPAPPLDSVLPDGIEQRAVFGDFCDAVEEVLPHLEIREDHAAMIAYAQQVADLGMEVPEPLVTLALEVVPEAADRIALRDLGARYLFPSTGSLEAVRTDAVAHVPDVREIPSRRERRRRARAARRTRTTERTS